MLRFILWVCLLPIAPLVSLDLLGLCVVDLALIIDDWKTISADADGAHNATKWNLIKTFVQEFTGLPNISHSTTHVAAATYGSTSSLKFKLRPLSRFDSKEQVVSDIGDFEHREEGDEKLSSVGFLAANNEIFKTIYGDRPEIPNVLVFFTDYIKETTKLMTEVNKAKDNGTAIIGIGFGNRINSTLMKMLVTLPEWLNYIEIRRFEDLNTDSAYHVAFRISDFSN